MSTVPYTSFYPEVLPFVHDCPTMVAQNAIRDACMEFCEETLFWKVDVPAQTLTAAQTSYPMAGWLPASTDPVKIVQAWFGLTVLKPKTEDELNQMYGWFVWNQQLGMPLYYTQETRTDLIIVPSPDTTNASTNQLTAIIAVKPSRASTTVYDQIYEHFAERIGHGARARLYQMAGQPFYDPKLAAHYQEMFDIGIAATKIQVNKSLTRADVRIRNRRWT